MAFADFSQRASLGVGEPNLAGQMRAQDGVRHLDLVGADGAPLRVSLPWSNGKEVTPVGEGMEKTRVVSRIQGRTVEDTWRRDGTIIEKVHGTVSADGRR